VLQFPMITAKPRPFDSAPNCSPHLDLLHSVTCHPERSEGSAFLPTLATHHSPLTTIPFRITSFACPHPLTPIESYSCKKQGGGGPLQFPPLLSPTTPADAQQRPQPLSAHGLTSRFSGYPGGGVTTHHSLPTTHSLPLETPTPNGASLSMYVQERPGGPGNQVPTMRRFLIAIVSLALLPAIASAQRGGMSGMGHAAVSAPHASLAMHAAPASAPRVTSQMSSGVRPPSGMHWVRTRSGAVVARPIQHTTSPVQRAGSGRQLLSQDTVPGLGFDYPHVAAVHPHGNNGHLRNRDFAFAYFPFYGGGYYMPVSSDDYVDDAPPADAQDPNTGEQQAAQTDDPERPSRPSRDYVPAPQTAAELEAEQYVFVRRDGTVFFAAAYAWENGTLRYITKEGLRHTLTADKLDLDATQRFNEQRGLTFRLPAERSEAEVTK
jgi:hypothetical protein